MIQVSCFKAEHLDAVLELEQLCFPEDPWSRASFEQELSNPLSVFLIAIDEDTNQLVGYGGIWLMYDAGNITNIAVHPAYRREGIGSKLLELLTEVCQESGMETITLEVRESNLPARALYERRGFVLCGVRKNYYQGKENAMIMTKELKKEGYDANLSD